MTLRRCAAALALGFPAFVTSCLSTDIPAELALPARVVGDAGAGAEGGGGSGQCLVPAGTPGNELGLGRYCEAGHAGQCALNLFCGADYLNQATGFCSGICNGDSDCGSNVYCYSFTAELKVCVPNTCKPGAPASG